MDWLKILCVECILGFILLIVRTQSQSSFLLIGSSQLSDTTTIYDEENKENKTKAPDAH